MMRRGSSANAAVALALLATLLGACSIKFGTIVLLPEQEGGGAAVVVRAGDEQVVLDRPFASVNLTRSGPRGYLSSPDEVQELFGPALAAQPTRPTRFTLYFVEGTDELTNDSKRVLDTVFAEIARRAVPDIVVIGHTDSVGSHAVNDTLARRRAESVRAALIRRDIASEPVEAVGRGKRELAVPTPDGVAEPRNRRVEIVVR